MSNELPKTIDELTPRIVDVMVKRRLPPTAYVSTGTGSHLDEPECMLEIEWQGRRYVIPAFVRSGSA